MQWRPFRAPSVLPIVTPCCIGHTYDCGGGSQRSLDEVLFNISGDEQWAAPRRTLMHFQAVPVSIVVSIPACHAGDRGSIPRRGGFIFKCMFHTDERLLDSR